jgi:hypothetical protein
LGEVDELGGLVDEDETKGDEAVDAADGQTVQPELQNDVQAALPRFAQPQRFIASPRGRDRPVTEVRQL